MVTLRGLLKWEIGLRKAQLPTKNKIEMCELLYHWCIICFPEIEMIEVPNTYILNIYPMLPFFFLCLLLLNFKKVTEVAPSKAPTTQKMSEANRIEAKCQAHCQKLMGPAFKISYKIRLLVNILSSKGS